MEDRRRFPLDRLLRAPEEIGFFVRGAIYGLGAAVIYWFMTYEITGTVLLGVWGLGSLAVAGVLQWRRPSHGEGTTRRESPLAQPVDGPYGDDPGLAPEPTLAPLEVAVGALLLLFMIPFGPWMAVFAAGPLAAGAMAWLGAAMRDAERTHRLEALADGAPEPRAQRPAPPGRAATPAPAAPTAPEPVVDRAVRVGVVAAIAAGIAVVLARLPGSGRTLPLLARVTGAAAGVAGADRTSGDGTDDAQAGQP